MPPPSKKSKRLSRKELQQLKDYGELDPLSSAGGGNDLDELISRAMSKNGSHRQAEVRFSSKKGRERYERHLGKQGAFLPRKEKSARPDAYSRLLKSLGGSSAVPAKRTAVVSDEEDEEEEEEYAAVDDDKSEHGGLPATDSEDEAAADHGQAEAGSDGQDEQEGEARSEDDLSEGEEEEEQANEEDDTEIDGFKEVFELKDYLAAHVADDDSPLAHKKLAAATQKEYKQVPIDDPILRSTVLFDTGNEGIKERNPRPLKQRLVKPFHKLNNSDRFTDYQASIFNWFDQYRDVVYAGRTIEHDDELTTAYALHAVNHVLKSRDRERKNNARLARAHATGKDAGELRDRGFTRPRVLVILPVRNSAYRFVEKVLRLLSSEQE
ncbi:rRNA-binding ribosome biosynthesis protein utp25, partial [Linderina pennispora]